MITAERLQELIKQGATICCIMNNSKYIADFDLSTGDFTVASDCSIIVEREVTGYLHGYGFEQLFETRERAEWHCKTTAERTERFEPPMWEDIEVVYTFDFITKGLHLRFAVDKHLDVIAVYKLFNGLEKDSTIFDEHATKENYIKACEKVKNLFNKGEKL